MKIGATVPVPDVDRRTKKEKEAKKHEVVEMKAPVLKMWKHCSLQDEEAEDSYEALKKSRTASREKDRTIH